MAGIRFLLKIGLPGFLRILEFDDLMFCEHLILILKKRLENPRSKLLSYGLLNTLQSFGERPSVFVTVKYVRSSKPNDAMYVWLENINFRDFEVCIREFLAFDGKHQDTTVVSNS